MREASITETKLSKEEALKQIAELPGGQLFVDIFKKYTNFRTMGIGEIHERGFDGFKIWATVDGVVAPNGVSSSMCLELVEQHLSTFLRLQLPLATVEVVYYTKDKTLEAKPFFYPAGINCVSMADPRMEKSLEILLEFAQKVKEQKK